MSQHPISQHRREQLLEIASDWVVRIQGGELAPRELDAWVEWLNASPEHRQAFDDAQLVWHDMGGLNFIQEPSDAAVAGDSYDGEAPIAVWRKRRGQRPVSNVATVGKSRWRPWALATAATVVLGVGALWAFLSARDGMPPPAHYTTVIAQHQSIELPDGSRVELGAATDIDVTYTDVERRIELREGVAYFAVEHDPGRPFVVAAGGGSVRAIGTEFSVQHTEQSVTVVVADGLVEVHKPLLATTIVKSIDMRRQPQRLQLPAGQQVSYSVGAGLELPVETNVEAVTAWREGRLVLQGKTLNTAIADINRYAELPIEFGDPAVGDLEVSGYVRTDEIDGWLNGLEAVFPIKVERRDGRIVLHRREADGGEPY